MRGGEAQPLEITWAGQAIRSTEKGTQKGVRGEEEL